MLCLGRSVFKLPFRSQFPPRLTNESLGDCVSGSSPSIMGESLRWSQFLAGGSIPHMRRVFVRGWVPSLEASHSTEGGYSLEPSRDESNISWLTKKFIGNFNHSSSRSCLISFNISNNGIFSRPKMLVAHVGNVLSFFKKTWGSLEDPLRIPL